MYFLSPLNSHALTGLHKQPKRKESFLYATAPHPTKVPAKGDGTLRLAGLPHGHAKQKNLRCVCLSAVLMANPEVNHGQISKEERLLSN